MNTGVELVGGNVLRRDRAGVGPIAGEGISEREVLASASIGIHRARDRLKHFDRVIGMTGEGQRQAVIGRIEQALAGVEVIDRFGVLPLGNLDQSELQHDLRLARVER